jgi:dolichol-phosphate mannosyltransferase
MHHTPISVVIPMYNEAENVAPFVQEIHQALNGKVEQFEIVVVDDGSTDDTVTQLKQLQSHVATLRVIEHDGNFGQSAATVSGIRAAKYPWIVTMDGDAQNDPGDIPALLAKLEAFSVAPKVILVAGNRAKRNDNLVRKLSSRIGNGVRNFILKDDCMDTGCSLKLFSREVFLQMPHFNHLHRFIPSLIKRANGQIINVPVNHRPRVRGVSKYGVMNRLWVGIVDLFGVRWLMSRPCHPKTKPES